MTIIGEMEDKVRYQSFAIITFGTLTHLVSQGLLGIKLLPLLQFQVFEQLLKFQFPEVTLNLHLASQGTRQSVSRLSDLCTLLHIGLDGRLESCKGFCLLDLGLVEGLLHILQTLLQGVDDLRYLFLVFLAEFGLTLLEHLFRGGLHLLLDKF